jgi:hypothetical protein
MKLISFVGILVAALALVSARNPKHGKKNHGKHHKGGKKAAKHHGKKHF